MALTIGLAGCGAVTHAAGAASSEAPATDGVFRATSLAALDGGHFLDPYPIDVSQTPGGAPLEAFSGTSDEVIACQGAVTPGCFVPSPISVTESPALSAQLRADGASVYKQANRNIFRMPDGAWEMALSVKVKRGSTDWTLCFHAHPQSDAGPDGIPSHWVADSILVGSPTTPAPANYDAKYLEAEGQLYLVYSRHLSNPPMGSDGLVAQKMTSPTQPAGSAPVTLLAPTEAGGGLSSEQADASEPDDHFKLVETGNITEIGSVWVLIYSTGTVNHSDYKVGVAYADSPVPANGYRKVLIPDPRSVWGSSGDEVDYLLQSQQPGWPHDDRAAVQAPGVGSIMHRGSAWYLFFAGESPTQQTTPQGNLDPSLRFPYYVKLHVAVPQSKQAVAGASDEQLSTWITPELGD